MKFLLFSILVMIFYRVVRSAFLIDEKKIKKTKEGKHIQFQDAEYEEID